MVSIERTEAAKKSSKKRKRKSDFETSLCDKNESQKIDFHGGIWNSLDLVLSLRNREIPNERKIELVFSYISDDQKNEVIQPARLISFLTDWVQPVLISTDPGHDFRLWVILKFCLEKSSVNVSHNLLRPISQGIIHASTLSDNDDSIRFLRSFIECASLLLSIHGRSFNAAGVELWISCAVSAVHLLSRISSKDCCTFDSKDELLSLLILLLDHFVNFTRFHPSPKTIFRPFVDRLLEPLAELLTILHEKGESIVISAVEDCLSNGLCHPSHISGFFALSNMSMKNRNESYHHHFFVKYQEIVHEKNEAVMGGLGRVFEVFVNSMNKSENGICKGLFEVFYQFMEPLFLDCKKFKNCTTEREILGFCITFRTVNSILEIAATKRIYDRTQDSAEGDFFGFLKRIYDGIEMACRKLYAFWSSKSNVHAEGLHLIAKELIVSIGHFLEIEYNVIGDDVTNIWFMMMSYLTISDNSFLKNGIIRVGRQLIVLYSDLRQATRPIFSLCKAVRCFGFHGDGSEDGPSTNFPSGRLSSDAFKKAIMTIVCSENIRVEISTAIKSIPEGQAVECLFLLRSDFSEALTWLKSSLSRDFSKSSLNNHAEAELFGLLSEIYCIVLESLVITGSNSFLIRNSVDELVISVKSPLESFMRKDFCDLDGFHSFLTGKSLSDCVSWAQTSWIFLCFFRLYVSCWSLGWNNSCITSSGKDWEGEGFVENPSFSLVSMIKAFPMNSCKEQAAIFSPLIYVLSMMVIQRLVDLKLILKSLNYLVERNKKLAQTGAQNKRLRYLIKVTRHEASDLVSFLIQPLLLFTATGDNKWDSSICSLDEKSLPVAVFWLLSRNIDLWPAHASRKGLKAFSSLLVCHWLDQMNGDESSSSQIAFHCIAAEVLSNVSFYEQPVISRHLMSRLSSIFKKTVQSIVSLAFREISDLSCPPDWSGKYDVILSEQVLSSLQKEVRTFEGLLRLSCILSEICEEQVILAVIICYILHLERFLVYTIISRDQLSHDLGLQLLNLFVSCRRTLKQLFFSRGKYCNMSHPSTIKWLQISVSQVVELGASFFGSKPSGDVNLPFFRLLDHTSCLFSSLYGVINASSNEVYMELTSVATGLELAIKESNLIYGKWNEISCILSCLQGFVWGLVSMPLLLDESPVEKYVDLFEEFLDRCLMMLPVDHDHPDHLKLPLLRSLSESENFDTAFLIRQIFLSAAGILKFRQLRLPEKSQKRRHFCNYLRKTSANVLIETAIFLSSIDSQSQLFVFLDGMIKYLEVLGSCLTVDSSILSGGLYSLMVTIHLKEMGRCISLQGKAATLASHEAVSELDEQGGDTHQRLEELKSRLCISFKELLREQLRSQFVLLIQSLGRVSVDMQRRNGIIAAGLYYLDLVFDSFSGDKLFGIVKDHAQDLVGSLFSIILHLQGPSVFYARDSPAVGEREIDADPGSTVLMCIEILRKFSRKNAQLKMDPCFVGQSLHVPSSLFNHFHQLTSSQSPGLMTVDCGFFLELYAACCRLLCTVIRHQKSETTQCVALLEDSTTSLLNCLESPDEKCAHRDGLFRLDVRMASTCAGFLRRVYEEIGQQKDSVGTLACHFLSDYLSLCSGIGPRKTGIAREVDEALRPGVYALVDICSPGDFQKLHTILGEGPCRRALANLRHDHKLYFQYQGKI